MNNQEIPVKDQEQPLSEGNGESGPVQEERSDKPVATYPAQQYIMPNTPPPFVPLASPPNWTGYYPGNRPPWTGQPGMYYPRKRRVWPWIVLTVGLLFLLLIGGVIALFGVAYYRFAAPTVNSVTEMHNFVVTANPTLVLINDVGSIHVRGVSPTDIVTIQAIKHGVGGVDLGNIQVIYSYNAETNTVTVGITRQPGGFNLTSADFDVTVPRVATLQLSTATGSISVDSVSGRMNLTSSTGSVAASGGMIRGNTTLRTNTGSVSFSGAIDRSGTYQFETNTGSVNVTLARDSAFHLNASTNMGSINTNFPGVVVQHPQPMGANAYGDVGRDPQSTVSLRTNTGSINLYQG